jgi:hypothetical protein
VDGCHYWRLHGVISGFFSDEKKFGEPSSKAEMDVQGSLFFNKVNEVCSIKSS